MKKPNFFIIGAPKCGTTSLASWLADHPSIYMSPVKEPQYYCDDFGYDSIRGEHDYLSLFRNANKNHKAIGEASATYLFSSNAVLNIESNTDNASYIVLLRNPVEMVTSLHQQLLFSGDENIKDFEKAWLAQGDREIGRRIPKTCRESSFLLYGKSCSLGAQMERLFQHVPRERILPIFLEDIKENPRKEWLNTLSFLMVEDDGRNNFPVKNKAKERSFRFQIYLEYMYSHLLQRIKTPPLGLGIMTYINKLNTAEKPRTKLSLETNNELIRYFTDDVKLLGKLLDRNLNHWLL